MGASSWKEQWINAFSVVPKDDDEEDEEGGELEGEAAPASADDKKVGPIFGHTLGEWALHVLTFPFKLACAIIPPTNIAGGIPCFFIAIVVIGVMTALIGDMANMLGCALGIESAVVAITFVALGTSLPDTFASMSAARGDATADAAIGNVTGSNAVNVFLGLGLSWMLGAIVWVSNGVDKKWLARYPQIVELYAKQGIVIVEGTRLGLAVPSGDLAVGVIVFSICAIVCIGVLFARRVFFGGELGNRMRYPTAILFVSLVRAAHIHPLFGLLPLPPPFPPSPFSLPPSPFSLPSAPSAPALVLPHPPPLSSTLLHSPLLSSSPCTLRCFISDSHGSSRPAPVCPCAVFFALSGCCTCPSQHG